MHDADHALLPGASVYGRWLIPGGPVIDHGAVSGDQGVAVISTMSLQTGVYRFCVLYMTRANYAYDPELNDRLPCISIRVGP